MQIAEILIKHFGPIRSSGKQSKIRPTPIKTEER